MKKRLLACILAAILLLTACSTAPTYPKMEMVFTVPGSPTPQYYNFVSDEWDFSHYTPLTAEWTEFLNATYSAQVEFMNETYGADWAYEPVEAYGVDMSESTVGFAINGVFDPNTNQVYLNEDMLRLSPENISPDQMGHIVHEGFHYLVYINCGTLVFGLSKGKAVLGRVFSESMTNLASIKWLNHIGYTDAAMSYMSNGYATGTALCQMLELACPDLLSAYAKADFKEINKRFNSLCSQHIQGENTGDMFATWLYSFDLLYDAEHRFKSTGNEMDLQMSMYYFLQNAEILAAITHDSHSAEFFQYMVTYDQAYNDGVYTETPTFIDYFGTLFYTEPEATPATAD